MRRNNTHSLQKINPNINSQKHYQSRVDGSPKTRLNFPIVGDSGYYGGVGRKHYEKSTEYIHKLILNPDYVKPYEPMSRSRSQGYLKIQNSQNEETSKSSKQEIQNKNDSLSKLQQQMFKKLSTQASPQKAQKINEAMLTPQTEVPKRKSSLNSPYNSFPFRIFDSVDNIYGIVHSPDKMQRQPQYPTNLKRKFNPTYLSSDLGYV